MNTMVEQIKGLPIGDSTARLIACLRMLQELYGEASDTMESLYGMSVSNGLIKDKLSAGYSALEKVLHECLMMSIDESLGNLTLKSI